MRETTGSIPALVSAHGSLWRLAYRRGNCRRARRVNNECMLRSETTPPGNISIGPLLQFWRRARQMSQLALAHEASVSPRHVCFLETGRAKPSREMVLLLADALQVPLRERNALLLAAGFAPLFRESSLDDSSLEPVRLAIDAIMAQQEPFPAVVMNRRWDIVATNGSARRFFGWLLDGSDTAPPTNVLRMMFDPRWIRPYVENWDAVAETLVRRVHREAVGGVLDEGMVALMKEILSYPGVPRRWQTPDLSTPLVPVIPVRFAKDGRAFSFFSTVTVIGTPQDVTLQELRIECFFPADASTTEASRRLARFLTRRASSCP
jgi:transcriptional regulator with XRE-family HTH domain